MKKALTILATAASITMAGSAFAQEPLKVGFIYIGPPGDFGWTYQHDEARKAMEKEFGDKIVTTYLESVPEGADAERSIERLARAGNKLIFTTSFGYMDPTIKVAKKFPDVKFEHATGYKTAENVSAYNARFYEGRYVQGQIAAKMSKNGTAGFIGSVPVPEVVQAINSFMLGAQSVNPDFKIKVIWANSWFDPGREADAAKALIDQGVDVLAQHTNSTAPVQVAAERGIKAFGQASDMIKFGPETQLTATVYNWSPYYIERTKAVLDGTWKEKNSFDGMNTGLVTMAPMTNMPDDVKAMAEETIKKLASGELKPFTGPLKKQDGSEWLKEGETADDATIIGMNFYVQGIDDQLPQ
ncbi:BMP family ABC transporter substrate-binding protein [Bacillus subtilis]|jgi:simple sugar transport system substrate-binding protein|uniref:BMP family ABC transporter substrate-binding protein n=1 Tax=Pseudochrobactrum asaccharolyticum TaxID=354351 RepID=UPI000EFB9B37|nr:BMP family ABC transporter substrate-binding protein [Pseudochrobactrum asaccharolyticum]MBX8801913.1 BMP family ABC transporter substrate-binding protein [Ochrobactrum sp. MR28]MBX8817465.1 BMP family ABC transporter substrate-binding protein [Ochrobactrum sp. MR31]MCF7671490.1 BMP family ABC transporter substrate-binding protein [Bacillus subtilis]MDR2312205.1 BMP family ABC transporter substrate-binding protein [Brucellaceae bacterium]MCF7645079.1 BMP family ABC transporter substrate-bin